MKRRILRRRRNIESGSADVTSAAGRSRYNRESSAVDS